MSGVVFAEDGGAVVQSRRWGLAAAFEISYDAQGMPVLDVSTSPGADHDIDEHNDANMAGLAEGQFIARNGSSQWVNRDLAAGDIQSGILAIARGGTNLGTYVQGDILYASAANVLSALAVPVLDGWVLTYDSGTDLPEWRAPDVGTVFAEDVGGTNDSERTFEVDGKYTFQNALDVGGLLQTGGNIEVEPSSGTARITIQRPTTSVSAILSGQTSGGSDAFWFATVVSDTTNAYIGTGATINAANASIGLVLASQAVEFYGAVDVAGALTATTGTFSDKVVFRAGSSGNTAWDFTGATGHGPYWGDNEVVFQSGGAGDSFKISSTAVTSLRPFHATTGTFSGDLTYTNDFLIKANTSDASDDLFMAICGGGDDTSSRGAYVIARGNEDTSAGTAGGQLILAGGNTTYGRIRFVEGGAFVATFDDGAFRAESSGLITLGNATYPWGDTHIADLYVTDAIIQTGTGLLQIGPDTSDGSDLRGFSIHAGGAAGSSRGAYVTAYGEDAVANTGILQLAASASGHMWFVTNSEFALRLDDTTFRPETASLRTLGTATYPWGGLFVGDASNYAQFSSTGDLIFVGSAGLAIGEIWVEDNSTETAIGVAGTWVQVTVFDTNGASNNTTADHTNDHITITVAGFYKIQISATILSGAGSAADYECEARINNGATAFKNIHFHRQLAGGGGDIGAAPSHGYADLAVNDTVEVWVRNVTNTTNLVFANITLTVEQKTGT